MGALKKVLSADEVVHLLQHAESAPDGLAKCTHCRGPMKILSQGPVSHPVELDLCRRCQIVWLDTGEWQNLADNQAAADRKEAIRDKGFPFREYASALMELERARVKHEHFQIERVRPESIWKLWAAFLALPVEEESDEFHARPWVTWTVAGICILISVILLSNKANMEWALAHLAFSPNRGFWGGLLTAFTSFFVHASWFHLFGNMYFLMVFGDNVEIHLNKRRYLALLALATLGGNLLFAWLDPMAGKLPAVGASGGIFGLISYYLLTFPYRRFLMFFFFRWYAIPAWFFGLIYIFFKEFIGALLEISYGSCVSHLAHLGGASVGVGFYIYSRIEQARQK